MDIRLQRAGQVLVGVTVGLAVLVGGGVIAHQEAVVVSLIPVLPAPDSDDHPYLRLSVRNRLATLLPMRGRGLRPGWKLERRNARTEWEVARAENINPSGSGLAWILPFQKVRFRIPVERPGSYRATVYSGTSGDGVHVTSAVQVSVAPPDTLPFTH